MSAASSDAPLELTYASYGSLDMCIDVFIPEVATAEKPAPILLWFHGGGLLQGTRKGAPHHCHTAVKNGLCLISADYRLAPQVKLPDIMQDCANLMTYIRSQDFRQHTKSLVDSDRICVSGGSAGGWLALLVGLGIGFKECGIEPPSPCKNLIIASLYPISDLQDPFWHTKQRPVSYMSRVVTDEEVAEHLDTRKPALAYNTPSDGRNVCYHYMVQEAILTKLLLEGIDIPPTAFSVAPAIREGRYTSLPPTYITHGTVDDKVPIQQADDVVEALEARSDKEVLYERIDGADHLYDRDEKVDMHIMYDFIRRHFA